MLLMVKDTPDRKPEMKWSGGKVVEKIQAEIVSGKCPTCE